MNSEIKSILVNAECVKILTDEGLMNALQPRKGSNMAATIFERDACTCLATNHIKQFKPEDNGFMIFMIPVSLMPRREAAEFFTTAILSGEFGNITTTFADPVSNS